MSGSEICSPVNVRSRHRATRRLASWSNRPARPDPPTGSSPSGKLTTNSLINTPDELNVQYEGVGSAPGTGDVITTRISLQAETFKPATLSYAPERSSAPAFYDAGKDVYELLAKP